MSSVSVANMLSAGSCNVVSNAPCRTESYVKLIVLRPALSGRASKDDVEMLLLYSNNPTSHAFGISLLHLHYLPYCTLSKVLNIGHTFGIQRFSV